MIPSHELFQENNNEKYKTKLHDYLNINVIKLSTVIMLNYRYGINIICQIAISKDLLFDLKLMFLKNSKGLIYI